MSILNLLIEGCPDCDSEAAFVHRDDGVHFLQIHHDDTCPSLKRIGKHLNERKSDA